MRTNVRPTVFYTIVLTFELILCIASASRAVGLSLSCITFILEPNNPPMLLRCQFGLARSPGETCLHFAPADALGFNYPPPPGIHTWVDPNWTDYSRPPLPLTVIEEDDGDSERLFTLLEEPTELPSHTDYLLLGCDSQNSNKLILPNSTSAGCGWGYAYIPPSWTPPSGPGTYKLWFAVCTGCDSNDESCVRTCSVGWDAQLEILPPPTLSASVVADGQIQRSTIKDISAQFSIDVTVDSNALSITGFSHGLTNLAGVIFDYNSASYTATWRLNQSLPDDWYIATLNSSKIFNSIGYNLDGNRDGIGGDDATFVFNRLFGDVNGDGIVDYDDFFSFASRWLNTPSNTGLDIDDNNSINFSDFASFANRWSISTQTIPKVVLIPAGEFDMGDHYDVGGPEEKPLHLVYVNSFYMSQYEITNQQYCDYLNYSFLQDFIEVRDGTVYAVDGIESYCDTTESFSYSRISFDGNAFTVVPGKKKHPMVCVSWYGAAAFCNWMSEQEGFLTCYDLLSWACDFSKNGYRLPTEAEWEYAARGSLRYYKFPWGNDIDGSKANYQYSGDSYESGPLPYTTPVGYYNGSQVPTGPDMANGYGLYDIAGNVWEWCNDWYDSSYYSVSSYDNPTGPISGGEHVLRGGSWHDTESFTGAYCRVAARIGTHSTHQERHFGFRIVRNSD